MKKYFLLGVLNLFILHSGKASSCDSIVVVVGKNFKYYSGWTSSVGSFVYNDGLLRNKKNTHFDIDYYYDSLGRLEEILSVQNDTFYSKTEYYYSSVSGKDTALLSMRFDGQNYYYTSGTFNSYDAYLNLAVRAYEDYDTLLGQWDSTRIEYYFYDVNQNTQSKLTEVFDTLLAQWDTSSNEIYFYSADSLTMWDTIYVPPSNQGAFASTTTWDTLGRVIGSSYSTFFYWGSGWTIYDTVCTSGILIGHSSNTSAGPNGYTTSHTTYWDYDSFCRPVHTTDSIWTDDSGPDLPYLELGTTDYYYADCNTIVVAGPDTVVTCPDQPVTLNLLAYGGSGPLSFSWTSSDSLSDYNVLNPIVFSDTGSICQLTVTDSIGNQAQFQMIVAVNHFTAAVTDATCDTCHNGSVNIMYPPPHPYYYLTVSPHAGSWNGTTLSGLLPGDYNICSRNGSCTYCDSVHVLSSVSVGEIEQENFIHVSPNPVTSCLNVKIDSGHSATPFSWVLHSIDGRILNSNTENKPQYVVPVEGLAKGIYFLEIIAGSRHIIKIIKD